MDQCRAQGLVLDRETKQCRESRRGAGLPAARAARAANRGGAVPVAVMRQACRDQGLVYDVESRTCRPRKQRLFGLEAAYARGGLFNFGLNAPPSALRPGIMYHVPASLTTGDQYPIIGPVAGKVTGVGSFAVDPSTVAVPSGLGVQTMVAPQKSAKFGVKTMVDPKKSAKFGKRFGTYRSFLL